MTIEYEPNAEKLLHTKDPNNGLICYDIVIFFTPCFPAPVEEFISYVTHGFSELTEHAITLRWKVL